MAAAHPVGTFCFAELHTPDLPATAPFYHSRLGWGIREVSADYSIFELDGRPVTGLRRSAEHRWIGYVRVSDVDVAETRATELGARVPASPADTTGIARTCLLADREGAILGVWSPPGLEGTAVDDGRGSLWWMELATGDAGAAQRYYSSLFGWGSEHTMKFENGPTGYTRCSEWASDRRAARSSSSRSGASSLSGSPTSKWPTIHRRWSAPVRLAARRDSPATCPTWAG